MRRSLGPALRLAGVPFSYVFAESLIIFLLYPLLPPKTLTLFIMSIPNSTRYRCAYSTGCRNVRSVISSRAHLSPGLTTCPQDSYLLGNASRRGKTIAALCSNKLSCASVNQMNIPVDAIDRTVELLTSAFYADPVYRWFLHDFPLSQYPNILPKFFRPFLVQALLNDALLIEAGNSSSCGLIVPPGSRLENPWTILQAGLMPAVWNVGIGTLKIYSNDCFASYPSFTCFILLTRFSPSAPCMIIPGASAQSSSNL